MAMKQVRTAAWRLAVVAGVCAGALGAATSAVGQDRGDAGADFTQAIARSALRERALSALTRAAESDVPVVRANAIEGLHDAPGRLEPLLPGALRDSNAGVRYVAAMTVGMLRLKDLAGQTRALVRDTEPSVSCAAIFALRRCGDDADPTPIGTMLYSRDMTSRSNAAFMLGELGDPSAIPMLKAAARDVGSMGQPIEQRLFRLQIAEATAKLGDPEAIGAIRAALYPATDDEYEAAALAAQILGELKDRAAAADLVNRVQDRTSDDKAFLHPPEFRLAAASALAQMGYRDGAYVAAEFLANPNPAIRAQSAMLLGMTVSAEELGTLEAMMEDPDPMVAVAAAAATVTAVNRLSRGG